jgi:nitrite reductase/ring-hydroxylating ferredoxin subunit
MIPAVRVVLCPKNDVSEGESRGFDPLNLGRDTLFVVRHGDQLYAWRDECPHERAASMAWRKNAYLNAARTRIVCGAHGAQFDIVTGLCKLGPCIGQSLEGVRIAVDDGGMIAAWLDCGAAPL